MKILIAKLLVVVFSLSFLTACGREEQLIFEGESDIWKVEYTVNNVGKDEVQQLIEIEYKDSDISAVGEFEFSVKSKLGKWGQGIIELDEGGKYTSSSSARFNEMVLTDKDKPIFSIVWNDVEGEIVLEGK